MKKFNYPENASNPNEVSEIVFYDTIQELPMFRLNEFQIHLCQDSGIGATLADFDNRLAGVYASLNAGDMVAARQELLNARVGLMVMLDSVSTKARCLADLVYSINGIPLVEFTDDALLKVHKSIMMRLSDAEAGALIDELKKKFKLELKIAFPSIFPDDEELQFYAYLIRRATLQLQDWESGAESQNAEINIIDKWMREQTKPDNFNSAETDNAIEEKRRGFEQVCAGLALYNLLNSELLTVYKFYARILFIQQHKPKSKSHDSLYQEL